MLLKAYPLQKYRIQSLSFSVISTEVIYQFYGNRGFVFLLKRNALLTFPHTPPPSSQHQNCIEKGCTYDFIQTVIARSPSVKQTLDLDFRMMA